MSTQDLRGTHPARPKLLDQVREAIRRRHYSYRTEETYVHWTHVMNKGGRGVKSPLDSGGTGQPPLARDVTAKYQAAARS